MSVHNNLENTLYEILSEGEVEDSYLNDTFLGVIYLMKSAIENPFAKEQFYEILSGRKFELPSCDDTDYFQKMSKYRERQFGLEFTLKQLLWDGQVPDDLFENTFTKIVGIMKNIVENKDYKNELYKINLKDYQDENE